MWLITLFSIAGVLALVFYFIESRFHKAAQNLFLTILLACVLLLLLPTAAYFISAYFNSSLYEVARQVLIFGNQYLFSFIAIFGLGYFMLGLYLWWRNESIAYKKYLAGGIVIFLVTMTCWFLVNMTPIQASSHYL